MGHEDVVLEDLRIVLKSFRGPGGTLWGANAVNGSSQYHHKSAKETKGGLIALDAGTMDKPSTSIRYGGQLARASYTSSIQSISTETAWSLAGGEEPRDPWSGNSRRVSELTGPEEPRQNTLTLQADYFAHRVFKRTNSSRMLPPYGEAKDAISSPIPGGNVLGRWQHEVLYKKIRTHVRHIYYFAYPQQIGVDYHSDTVGIL